MRRMITLLLLSGLATLCGSSRSSETDLTGLWRAETTDVVMEIALCGDHTFTSWLKEKNALTTPSCPTSAGGWKLQNQEIVVDFTSHIAVDGWEHEDKQLRFAIVKIAGDTLELFHPEEKCVISYKRLFGDQNVKPCTRAPDNDDLFGSWGVHYNTHDYEIVLGKDHRFGVFANMPDWQQPGNGQVRKQLWIGTWRIENGRLLSDARTVSSFEGESIQSRHGEFPIIGIERDRIAVREGPVRYVWHRLK